MCRGQLYSKTNTEPLQKSGSRFRGRKEGEFWWLVVLWVLHSCCESCLSRMKKRRQSDVILQEQGLLMTYVQLWVVWLFSWSLEVVWETVTFMLGVFLPTWPHKPCFSCDMRMRKKVLFEHAPPLQRQQGTLRRPINLGNTTMLLWWLCLVLASQVDGCSGSWPQGGLPEEPPNALRFLWVSWVLWPWLCITARQVSGNLGPG